MDRDGDTDTTELVSSDILILSSSSDFTSENNAPGRTDISGEPAFMVLANDGGALSEQTSEMNASAHFSRLTREWRVQATTSFTQSVNLKFEGYNNEWVLLKKRQYR